MWLAKDILSVTLGLVLFPSTSPQSFTQQFLCPSLHWQPPTFYSQSPEVGMQSLPKGFNVGHQLSFSWQHVSPWPVGFWEGVLSKLLRGCEGSPSGDWVVYETPVGPVLRTTFYLTHNWQHRKAKQQSSCQLTQPSWATGNILLLDSNMPVNCGCFPFCQVSQLLWAFRPTHWSHEALIKSTCLEIKR